MSTNADQNHNAYIGDVVNGLAKEAALWKARALQAEQAVNQQSQELAGLRVEVDTLKASNAAIQKELADFKINVGQAAMLQS